jgi:O-antigen/teichoic acid export membrane protein
VTAVLGNGYGADVGDELGHLVALLAPWMVFAIAFSVTLPLLFVQARTHGLVLVSLGLVALNVPLAWAGQSLAGLTGLSLALAATTVVADAVMLHRLHAAAPTLAGLLRAAAGIAALGCVAFGLPALVLGTGAAACVGLVLYAGALALVRPAGLLGSWRYLRSLV